MRRHLLALLIAVVLIASGASAVQYINQAGGANLSIGNNNEIFIDNTNDRVGIGTTTPSQRLDVNGNVNIVGTATASVNVLAPTLYSRGGSAASGNIIIQSDAGGGTAYWISAKTDGRLHLGGTGGAEPSSGALIIASGNVGIGTTPGARLDVTSPAGADRWVLRVQTNSTNPSGFWTTSESYNLLLRDAAGNLDVRLRPDGDSYFTGGNVGIGTASPGSLLHVSAGTSGDAQLRVEADTDNNAEDDLPEIFLAQDGGSAGFYLGPYNSSVLGGNVFRIGSRYSSVDYNEFFTIQGDDGSVGIGTNSPGEQLDVVGDTRIRGTGSTIGLSNLANAWLLVGSSTSGVGIDNNEIVARGAPLNVGTVDAQGLLLVTNGAVRATISSAGTLTLTSGTGINEFSTDGTLGGNSDNAVPTEQAVRTYVDTAISASSSNWTLAGTSGTPQTVSSGQTATIAAGTGITTSAAATRTVTVGLTGQALALHNLAASGIVARTGAGAFSARTITGTANQVTVTNGDGVSGNPTLSLPQNIHTTATPTFSGITTDQFAAESGRIRLGTSSQPVYQYAGRLGSSNASSGNTGNKWINIANVTLNGDYNGFMATLDVYPGNPNHGKHRQTLTIGARNGAGSFPNAMQLGIITQNVHVNYTNNNRIFKDLQAIHVSGSGSTNNIVEIWAQLEDSWLSSFPVVWTVTGIPTSMTLQTSPQGQYDSIPSSGTVYGRNVFHYVDDRLYIGSTDVYLERGAANRLDLASGDSFNIVSGNLQAGGTTVIDSSRNLVNIGNITAATLAILPEGIRGSASGASDRTIWAISNQYPNWGIFYNEGSPDLIEFQSAGSVTASVALDTGAGSFSTINTGQGAYELYAMDQNVRTTDAVSFATINTGSGAMELGDAAISNGDTNSIPTNDQVYDFVTGLGYGTGSGNITSLTAGSGLTGGGSSGAVTVNVGAGTGITVNADDVALTGQALALHNLGANGLIARTGAGTVAARTITGTANQVIVTNGDGVSANPTLSLPQNIHTGATPTFSRLTLSQATGTAPLTVSSTTLVANLNADQIDGLDSTAFSRIDGATDLQTETNLAAGWYTIATNTGNRAIARFGLRDVNSGDHQSVVFYAAHHYGTDASNTITVLHNSHFSGSPFRYIRIKDGTTYDGAALQVYIDDPTNVVTAYLLGDNFQTNGWVLKDWIPDASDPGDLDNYSLFTAKAQIDLDQIAQGGLATTGPIYAGGDTTQYELWHSNNDGSGSTLDADLLDGQNGSYYQPASSALTTSTSWGGDLTGTGSSPTIAANSVALGTDTTGNYAGSSSEGGPALTGDSATAFFSTGTLEVARGGTGAGAFTAGSVVFAGASGVYAQDSGNLVWDDSNNRLGIGTNTPQKPLDITASGGMRITRSENASANNEILFVDNGQIRSADDNHRIIFDRAGNALELMEYGNIVFSSGATTGTRTSRFVMTSAGDLRIGTANRSIQDADGDNRITFDSSSNNVIITIG